MKSVKSGNQSTNNGVSSKTTGPQQVSDSLNSNAVHGPCFAKLLVTNNQAGCIIGRNGSVISYIESVSHCSLRLSNADVYFPGTMQRICIISGDFEGVSIAYELILKKIKENSNPTTTLKKETPDSSQESKDDKNATVSVATNNGQIDRFTITIIIPKTSVSTIIGKKGEAIKNLAQSSNTKIVISEKDNSFTERMISIFGSYTSLIAAGSSILEIIQNNPLLRSSCLHFDYRFASSSKQNLTNNFRSTYKPFMGSIDDSSPYPGVPLSVFSSNSEINFKIPNQAVGSIIGKHGSTLYEIIKKTGAKITVSQKKDVDSSNNYRSIDIKGTLSSVHYAHALLTQQYISFIEPQDNITSPKQFPGTRAVSTKGQQNRKI